MSGFEHDGNQRFRDIEMDQYEEFPRQHERFELDALSGGLVALFVLAGISADWGLYLHPARTVFCATIMGAAFLTFLGLRWIGRRA